MTNTKHHQSRRPVFSSQSDRGFEELFLAPRFVLAVTSADIPSPAGATARLPLDADELDISRDSARLPARPIGERPYQSTHSESGTNGYTWTRPKIVSVHNHQPEAKADHLLHQPQVATLVQFDHNTQSEPRTSASRLQTGTDKQASGSPKTGEAPQQRENPQASEGLRERPRRGVWQDKARLKNAREASSQPAAVKEFTRSQPANNPVVRSQTHNGKKPKLAQVTLWVDPVVKDHLVRLAQEEGLSLSAAGAAFLARALQQHIDLEYSALLEPIIEHAIAKHMRGISTRLAWLLVRVSIDSGQTRGLVTNILGRQPGMTTDLLRSIVKQSGETARGNITRRTPQLEDLVASVEKWLNTQERGEDK